MKKNISINISGIIFHIEEDGYETLRKYLDSINRYFASFEDSSEILADIESRIAEIFLSRLNEGKQVITAEDVSHLMGTMGSVSDFKAAEEQEFAAGEPRQEQRQNSEQQKEHLADKRLYRDERRKILGGVCAGLGHYFNVDPVWPRLLFALLVLGSYGGLLLVYIILWIVLPVSSSLEEEATVKKMYRDPERKVLGGVAAGVAAFFGADITLIRLLFIIFGVIGGLGFIVYIILWIALPEAKTITEKMEMQGEPVTLSNIESTVKKGINEKEGQEESTLAKVVLFPFRLIAALINGLAKVLGPLFSAAVDVFRIAIGLIITLTGVSIIIALIIAFGVAMGLFSVPQGSFFNDWYVSAPNLPIDAIRQSFPTWTVVFAFLSGFIPALFLALLGSSIIARKIIFHAYVGWSLFVLFFVSLAFLSFTIPQMVYAFKEEGEHKVEQTFVLNGRQPVLRLNEVGYDDYDVTDLTLRGYEGNELKLVQRFGAQGNTRKVAIENAKMVTYQVQQNDSLLVFDSNITFEQNALFRAQRLDMDLFIPYDQPFTIEEEMWQIIDNVYEIRGYIYGNMTHTWKMTRGGMECISCEEHRSSLHEAAHDQFGLANFNAVDIEGLLDVRITQGNEYAVELDGPEEERRRYELFVDGKTLVVDFKNNDKFFWNKRYRTDSELKLNITMPSLEKLEARGAGKIVFRGFNEEDLEVKLLGAVVVDGTVDARNVNISMTGASFLDLNGEGDFLEADITGACGLRAYGFEVNHAIIEAHGASTAKVFVNERLEVDKGIASNVSHRGEAEVINRN
jgi:phage shock protein PspC (stress-responsive transcriptional regulator)